MGHGRRDGPSGEILIVWALFALEAAATFVTYTRLPPDQLYRVSDNGPVAGAGRVLVLLNYPIALAAIAVVGVLLERGAPRLLSWLAIVLCALTPLTVDQNDLDARLVNVLPAFGVALAAALTILMRPTPALAPRRRLDRLRLLGAALLGVLSIPWLFAELGFYAPDPILADELRTENDETIAAVHVGFHHGMGGALLGITAIVLSRVARSLPLRAAVSLMFVYGVGNAVEDAWHEQVVKRAWTHVAIPSILLPSVSPTWAVVLALAALLTALSARRRAGSAA